MPEEFDPDAFRVIDLAIKGFSQIFDHGNLTRPITYLGMVQVYVVLRAYNLLKCVRHLLSGGYWEECNILLRTLFELLLTLEHIQREEPEKRAKDFFRRAVAARLVHIRNDLIYQRETGRRVDIESIERIEKHLTTFLREFLDETTFCKQYLRLKRYTRPYELTSESARHNPIRKHQYYTLYSEFCEYVHGLPSAVLGDLQALVGSIATDKFLLREKHQIRMVIGLAVTWAIEILFLSIDALPVSDSDWPLQVIKEATELLSEHG